VRRRRGSPFAALLLGLAAAAPAAAQVGLGGAQGWSAGSPGLPGAPEAGAWFGHATVAGDFDGDGHEDLAISSPRATVGGDAVAGEVLVLYGSPDGLVADGHQLWNQDSTGLPDASEPNDFFGWSLAAGDFDADGFADLVVGVPFEDVGGFESAGALHVLRGSAAGLTTDGTRYYEPGNALIPDAAEPGDQFGAALAVGDFDEDGFDDLAVGSPGEDQEGVPTYVDLGALHVFFGSATGLQASGSLFFRPGDGVITVPAPDGDLSFAAALAAGPLVANGQDQIAIGIPRLDVDGEASAGGVVVLNNVAAGGAILGIFTQATTGVPGVPEEGDSCGASLALGAFDGGPLMDVVVGCPGEAVGADADAGAIVVLTDPFTPELSASLWTQDSLPPFESEAEDRFGAELAIGDFDADGRDDLGIGHPGETIGGVASFGGGALLFGSADGLTADGFQGLPLGTFKVTVELQFGYALAAGRFSGHDGDDLAMSLPRSPVDGEDEAGAVSIFPSIVLFRDGFESGDVSEWTVASL
jgi:hypothetical protein